MVAQHQKISVSQVRLQARLFLVAKSHTLVAVVGQRGQHKVGLLADGQHAALLRTPGDAGARVGVPLTVGGTLDNPELTLSRSALLGAAVDAALMPGVGTAVGAHLGERLRGLFAK